MQIFLGTWCGDSKREVPRFMKLLNEIGFSANNIEIITVGDSDSLYKQSPQHEEKGLGIFRVPTFIIYKNGIEINRINEYPVNSLEKDLLTIITNQVYIPNYRSFGLVNKWLNDSTLSDENISSRGIAGQLKQLVAGENELNSLGYLLLRQNKKKEALKLFQINYNLYPEAANIISSLGEGYLKNNDTKNALIYLERALEANKDPKAIKSILDLLYVAKGLNFFFFFAKRIQIFLKNFLKKKTRPCMCSRFFLNIFYSKGLLHRLFASHSHYRAAIYFYG
jgi:tetratricopeptide (TPR) repeat protein